MSKRIYAGMAALLAFLGFGCGDKGVGPPNGGGDTLDDTLIIVEYGPIPLYGVWPICQPPTEQPDEIEMEEPESPDENTIV